jgi:hypothetical protein
MARYQRVAKRPVVVVTPPAPSTDYNTLLKADLVSLAEKRGLDTSGTKADLVARLDKP